MSAGWIAVAGLGPGDEALVTPEVRAALAEATDVVGYIPYVARVAARDGLTLHPSDNRVELDRALLSEIEAEVTAFLSEVDEAVVDLRARYSMKEAA